jgi:hypothetical protein
MDITEPARTKLRNDNEDPNTIKSRTLMDDPSFVIPYTDKADPART